MDNFIKINNKKIVDKPHRDVAVVIFHDDEGNIGVQHRESYSKSGEKI